ncbi:MAG: NADH-quinone oxidoreductase subunit N [Deltaproteobacteria bacterium]
MNPLANAQNVASLAYFGPETVITLGLLGLFVLDVLWKDHPKRVVPLTSAFVTILMLTAVALALSPTRPAVLFNRMIVSDGLGLFFKWIFLATTAYTAGIVVHSSEIPSRRLGEFYALLLAVLLGMNLMAVSSDLLMVYLSLELVSMVSYALAGFRKNSTRSTEAALKYVIYGGVASGIMLFGISYFYGLFGTTDLMLLAPKIRAFSGGLFLQTTLGQSPAAQLAMVVAIVFVLAGVGFKMAAAPWHMWCPDVYEGAPTPFTAFLSVGPKAAAFAVAIRFFGVAFTEQQGAGLVNTSTVPWPAILGVLAAVTMTVGNLTALNQTNLKRLLAYSSIAHAGYLLMGLAAASVLGFQSVLVYLFVYLFMNLGAFLVVTFIAQQTGSETITEYRGLIKRAPFTAIAFTIFLFSLTGLPPLAGFTGKYLLFAALLERGGGWYVALALCGAVNSAISLYYYARIVKAMILDKGATEEKVALPHTYGFLMMGSVAALVVFGLYWNPLYRVTQLATASIFRG